MKGDEFVYKKVDRIVFGLFSPKQVQKMSAVKVVTPELYDKEGYPVDGGLMDVRLGVIDPGLRCKTCGGRLKECPGHFGYIELARPIIHYKFVRVVLDILRATCKGCGRILVPDNKIARYKKSVMQAGKEEGPESQRKKVKAIIARLKTRKKCPHCTKKQSKIILEKPTTFYEDENKISPIEIRARLERIPDDDVALFGMNPAFARPEWMVLTVLAIPPVTIRPSITLESGERSEDDLTHKLGDVVRINQRLFENINAGAPEIIIEDLWDLLQYHITTFFDNEVTQIPPARHRGGQLLKTIAARIKSKEGRIRHNLAGKRTNFSARTVISPDPMISLNEVGIPKQIAQKLTVPERITPWNKEYLKKFVEHGAKMYPGANYVVRPDGRKKRITDETREEIIEELAPGYIIERHLLDGDVAIFNRQPSLHRMSMMAHKVRVLPGRTLRLHPAVCNPYNADFDGDEMNLHIPQTEEARAEAEILMMVQTQLISPRYGLPVLGCIQDSITGNYILTKKLELTKEEAIELLSSVGVIDFSNFHPRGKTVTGKQIFSALLPADFNAIGKTKINEPAVIENGQIVEGVMDSSALGEESGWLLRALHQKYGPDYTLDMLGKIARLGVKVLLKHGFTVGIADTDLSLESSTKIKDVLQTAEAEVDELIKTFERGELEAFPGRTIAETLELRILEVLNKARNRCGAAAMDVKSENSAMVMARSGARGNVLNIAQMSAVVGQQALRGKRIERGYKGRTLSYFKAGDLSPAARGFIKSSFKSGMNPAEFFFGSMTGRDSLMDTALRTPKSGYLYRRLSNAMQDLKVEYDKTVRDVSKRIIQFSYGEDGVDVSRSENGQAANVKAIIQEAKK
ncbi:MAG TPA: DNA-directed RNA polymerase subunit A' [Candidatus Nanoarchaeia archaeon]|nr:DNA-directed RNA polymerase subunit A' [Candidatus Nanoarchaeia archaeon]